VVAGGPVLPSAAGAHRWVFLIAPDVARIGGCGTSTSAAAGAGAVGAAAQGRAAAAVAVRMAVAAGVGSGMGAKWESDAPIHPG
jgi:hypothetical protein